MGMCETLWEPKMKPDQLFECISQVLCFLSLLSIFITVLVFRRWWMQWTEMPSLAGELLFTSSRRTRWWNVHETFYIDTKDVRLIACPLRLPPEPWKPGWTKAPYFFTERTTTTKVLSSDHLCPMWTSSGPHMSKNKVREIPESKCPNFRGFEIWKSLQTTKNSDGPSSSVVRGWPWWHGRRSATSWCTCCGYCWAGFYYVIFMLY